jgi:hypothetical protein
MAAMFSKQEDTQQTPQKNIGAGSHEGGSRVLHQVLENECQDIVEEPTPPKQKKKLRQAYRLLMTSSLKEKSM